jgi:hypothetical protein
MTLFPVPLQLTATQRREQLNQVSNSRQHTLTDRSLETIFLSIRRYTS